MAETTNIAAGTIGVVCIGTIAKDGSLSIRVIIGGTVYVFMLAGIAGASPIVGKRIAILVLITALMVYGIPIFQKLGLLEISKGKPKPKKARP